MANKEENLEEFTNRQKEIDELLVIESRLTKTLTSHIELFLTPYKEREIDELKEEVKFLENLVDKISKTFLGSWLLYRVRVKEDKIRKRKLNGKE